jgi:hypothetical protein
MADTDENIEATETETDVNTAKDKDSATTESQKTSLDILSDLIRKPKFNEDGTVDFDLKKTKTPPVEIDIKSLIKDKLDDGERKNIANTLGIKENDSAKDSDSMITFVLTDEQYANWQKQQFTSDMKSINMYQYATDGPADIGNSIAIGAGSGVAGGAVVAAGCAVTGVGAPIAPIALAAGTVVGAVAGVVDYVNADKDGNITWENDDVKTFSNAVYDEVQTGKHVVQISTTDFESTFGVPLVEPTPLENIEGREKDFGAALRMSHYVRPGSQMYMLTDDEIADAMAGKGIVAEPANLEFFNPESGFLESDDEKLGKDVNAVLEAKKGAHMVFLTDAEIAKINGLDLDEVKEQNAQRITDAEDKSNILK